MISYSVGSERAQYYSDQWSFPFYIALSNILCLNSLWVEAREGGRVSAWSPQPSMCHTIGTFHEFQPMELARNNALFKKVIIMLQNFLFSSFKKFSLFSPSPAPVLNKRKLLYKRKGIFDESWTLQCLSRGVLWNQPLALLPLPINMLGSRSLSQPLYYQMRPSTTP